MTGPICEHVAAVRSVEPRTAGCEECLATGSGWVHLRLCLWCYADGAFVEAPA